MKKIFVTVLALMLLGEYILYKEKVSGFVLTVYEVITGVIVAYFGLITLVIELDQHYRKQKFKQQEHKGGH